MPFVFSVALDPPFSTTLHHPPWQTSVVVSGTIVVPFAATIQPRPTLPCVPRVPCVPCVPRVPCVHCFPVVPAKLNAVLFPNRHRTRVVCSWPVSHACCSNCCRPCLLWFFFFSFVPLVLAFFFPPLSICFPVSNEVGWVEFFYGPTDLNEAPKK